MNAKDHLWRVILSAFNLLGVPDGAVAPLLRAGFVSFWYTASGNVCTMLLFMTTVGHVSTPSEAMMWLSANGWPFLWGQLLVPFLRAHAAANLYQPDPLMEKK